MNKDKNNRFTKKQIEFIEYLVGNGNGTTKKAVARDIGVSVRMINNWLKDELIMNEVYCRAMMKISKELPKVLDALIENAKKGNVQAIKLILDQAQKKKTRIDITNNLTTEDALKILRENEKK
ncbi:hypothetical protein DRQ09_02440 [candidate division KSB1 bacterium]|nr:MAG: hypothetical protein DRQ09_02440 [candidate division KSB1 bacterium]